MEAKDAAEAVRNLQLAADQGDVLAQNILGTMYAAGVGIPKDAAEAVRYFQLAADQGHASAQHSLGLMYDAGEGVAQDDAEAERWFRLAADQGVPGAQFELGLKYARGEGVVQNDAEAVRWFRLAADQGHASAQGCLGAGYARGEGVAQDDPEAVRWLQLAADQGEAVPQHDLGEMYADGRGGLPQDDVTACMWYTLACAREPELISSEEASGVRKNLEQRMTHAQVTEAQRLAREWEAEWPLVVEAAPRPEEFGTTQKKVAKLKLLNPRPRNLMAVLSSFVLISLGKSFISGGISEGVFGSVLLFLLFIGIYVSIIAWYFKTPEARYLRAAEAYEAAHPPFFNS